MPVGGSQTCPSGCPRISRGDTAGVLYHIFRSLFHAAFHGEAFRQYL